jgi:polysaccharide biosynthesis transport protein
MVEAMKHGAVSSGRDAGGDIDMRALFQAIARRKAWIIVPTLLAFLIALISVMMITPRYASEARIFLERGDSYYSRPERAERDGAGLDPIDQEAVQSQVQIIMSKDLARQAIKSLGLINKPEFDPQAGLLGGINHVLALIGLRKSPTETALEDRVMETYYDRLFVYPVQRSRVIGIEFTSEDPDLAAKAANTIATLYLGNRIQAKQARARTAGTWLSGSLDQLRLRVQEAETKVEGFRARTGLISTSRSDGTNPANLPQQQLAEISTRLSEARSQLADAQAKGRLLRDMIRAGRQFEISDVANNETNRRLVEQRGTLKAQIALESRTLLPEHPTIKALNAQLADIEGQIRASAERTVRAIENDARISAQKVRELETTLDEHKKKVVDAGENEPELRALEREAKTLREQYESLSLKYREAAARDAENATPADASVISNAIVPPKPSFPKKGPIVLIVTLGTALIAFSILLTSELLKGGQETTRQETTRQETTRQETARQETPRQDEEAIRPVSQGPRLKAAPAADPALDDDAEPDGAPAVSPAQRMAAIDAKPADASPEETDPDAFSLADRIVQAAGARQAEADRGFVTLVESISDTAGTASLSLAADLCAHGKTIHLRLAGDEEELGLSDLLDGEASFGEVIHRLPHSDLHLIGPGAISLDECLAMRQPLSLALGALRETYAYIVLAAGPGSASAHAADLAGLCDLVVLARLETDDEAASIDAYRHWLTESGKEPFVLGIEAGREPATPEGARVA